jgi:hypothetical protein
LRSFCNLHSGHNIINLRLFCISRLCVTL